MQNCAPSATRLPMLPNGALPAGTLVPTRRAITIIRYGATRTEGCWVTYAFWLLFMCKVKDKLQGIDVILAARITFNETQFCIIEYTFSVLTE